MSQKPRRPSIREATPWGTSVRQPPPAPEDRIRPDGTPAEMPATIEELRVYRREAQSKLTDYTNLIIEIHNQVKSGHDSLEQPEATDSQRLVGVQQALAQIGALIQAFDHNHPRIKPKGSVTR